MYNSYTCAYLSRHTHIAELTGLSRKLFSQDIHYVQWKSHGYIFDRICFLLPISYSSSMSFCFSGIWSHYSLSEDNKIVKSDLPTHIFMNVYNHIKYCHLYTRIPGRSLDSFIISFTEPAFSSFTYWKPVFQVFLWTWYSIFSCAMCHFKKGPMSLTLNMLGEH